MKNVCMRVIFLTLSFTGLFVTTSLVAGMKDDYKKAIGALHEFDENKLSKILNKYTNPNDVEKLHKYDGGSGIILARCVILTPEPSKEKMAKLVKVILDHAAIAGLKFQNYIIKYDEFLMPSAKETAKNCGYKAVEKMFDDLIEQYKKEKKNK